jgi:prepilin-type N-terminal cleavage/methylation domain-containing protein
VFMLADNPRVPVTAARPRAFTVIELLVVMAVVGVLLSLLVVSISAATRSGQSANTRSLMAAIKQGLVRFRADIGYLPPVLGVDSLDNLTPADLAPANHVLRKLFDPRGEGTPGSPPIWGYNQPLDDCYPDQPGPSGEFQPNGSYAVNIQNWYSYTSLAEYLVGYGNHGQDGYGANPANLTDIWTAERPPLGIRHPDADGVWGGTIYHAANGSLADRMRYPGGGGATPSNADIGPVYGPYIDLKDDRLLASADVDVNGKLVLAFPGEGAYRDDLPKVLVDYWGNPIRYYRRLYAPGALSSEYRPSPPASPSGQPVKPPTLADVYLLRPFKISPGSAIDGIPDHLPPPVGPDPSTTATLRSAEFALFSAGLDKSLNDQVRYDAVDTNGDGRPDYFNEDNIVETGP